MTFAIFQYSGQRAKCELNLTLKLAVLEYGGHRPWRERDGVLIARSVSCLREALCPTYSPRLRLD